MRIYIGVEVGYLSYVKYVQQCLHLYYFIIFVASILIWHKLLINAYKYTRTTDMMLELFVLPEIRTCNQAI